VEFLNILPEFPHFSTVREKKKSSQIQSYRESRNEAPRAKFGPRAAVWSEALKK